MKIPCIIDMRKHGAKEFVQNAINVYGKTKDINQLAQTVLCKDDVGNLF